MNASLVPTHSTANHHHIPNPGPTLLPVLFHLYFLFRSSQQPVDGVPNILMFLTKRLIYLVHALDTSQGKTRQLTGGSVLSVCSYVTSGRQPAHLRTLSQYSVINWLQVNESTLQFLVLFSLLAKAAKICWQIISLNCAAKAIWICTYIYILNTYTVQYIHTVHICIQYI